MNNNLEQGFWGAIKGFFFPKQSQVFDKRRPYRFLVLAMLLGLVISVFVGLLIYYINRPGPH